MLLKKNLLLQLSIVMEMFLSGLSRQSRKIWSKEWFLHFFKAKTTLFSYFFFPIEKFISKRSSASTRSSKDFQRWGRGRDPQRIPVGSAKKNATDVTFWPTTSKTWCWKGSNFASLSGTLNSQRGMWQWRWNETYWIRGRRNCINGQFSRNKWPWRKATINQVSNRDSYTWLLGLHTTYSHCDLLSGHVLRRSGHVKSAEAAVSYEWRTDVTWLKNIIHSELRTDGWKKDIFSKKGIKKMKYSNHKGVWLQI